MANGTVARLGEGIRRVCDRFWMFTIAAIALMIIGGICIAVLWTGRMPENSEGLLGGAITGLLLLARDVINAIRGFQTDQQIGQMADKLHSSAPAPPSAVGEMKVDADRVDVNERS